MAGERVRHPVHGGGSVLSWRRGGRFAVVRFDGRALPLEVPSAELDEHEAPLDPAQRITASQGRDVAAQTLEAMRLGVVADAELTPYTVGRDAELAQIEADLDATGERGAVRAFLADYGVGKTHLLELTQRRALQRGFLATTAVLGRDEVAPSHPKRVYRRLMHGLRYPDRPADEAAGLGPLLERAAASPEALSLLGLDAAVSGDLADKLAGGLHLYLSTAVSYTRGLAGTGRDRDRDLLIDWIEGHPTLSNSLIFRRLAKLRGPRSRIYSLQDFRPWARIYGYLLSGIAALARAVGYQGLVVLLDEAEFFSLLSKQNRDFARNLFKAWSWAAVGGDEAPFAADEVLTGGQGVQRTLPGRYGDGAGLYVVYAMTPSGDGVDALAGAVPSEQMHTLTSLGDADYRELASRVCAYYASAHPDAAIDARLVGALGKVVSGLVETRYLANPRQAMKFLVEFLDIARHHPTKVGTVVRSIQLQTAL